MAVRFETGDPDRPKGHALLYFRSAANQEEILATYVVVLPIAINVAKYIPPAFAARMQQPTSAVAATALPPIPEAVESLAYVRRLAEYRGDDVLDGGVMEADPERLMFATHEVSQEYAGRYQQAVEQLPASGAPRAGGPAGEPAGEQEGGPPDEDTLRWMFLSEKERIGELAKLTGQLRYAVDGGDEHLTRSTLAQIEKLKAQLPEKYRIGEFLVAARRQGDIGRRLAELYIERCYKLSNEEYEALANLDREIAALEASL
jgi:hypothetical protein